MKYAVVIEEPMNEILEIVGPFETKDEAEAWAEPRQEKVWEQMTIRVTKLVDKDFWGDPEDVPM